MFRLNVLDILNSTKIVKFTDSFHINRNLIDISIKDNILISYVSNGNILTDIINVDFILKDQLYNDPLDLFSNYTLKIQNYLGQDDEI